MGSSSEEEELLSLDSHSDSDNEYRKLLTKKKHTKKLKKRPVSVDNTPGPSTSCGYALNDTCPVSSTSNDVNTSSESEGDDGKEDGSDNVSNGITLIAATNVREDAEITLSDDDAHDLTDNHDVRPQSGESSTSAIASNTAHENEGNESTNCGYGLRRKRKVNYLEVEGVLDPEDKKRLKKEVFDIFSLPVQKITRFVQKPELVDRHTKCKVTFMDGTDLAKIRIVGKFFEKCGQQFENMFIQTRYDDESINFLKTVFKATTALGKLDYRYQNQEDAFGILNLLKTLRDEGHLPSLHTLKLVSITGQEYLTERHINLLAEASVSFQSVELGDALWEDVKASTIEKFLTSNIASLENLIIHGGFRGEIEKERILITFPKMKKLSTLCICPSYTFLSEFKNPHSKKARVITLGPTNREEPYKIAIKFKEDLPTLKRLVLGNLIEMEDLLFSSLRKLSEFKCGSYWNLAIRFPAEGSRKALMESCVTELQFPDALKDPSFTVKVAKHFPNLKKVWMFLPSVPVLRAFFKSFENSKLEELYLKTQFDFESTMESCLLPNLSDVLTKSRATETLVQTLKEYKHFDEYVRYHNVELPVEAEDLMEGHSAGIRALRNLKILHLEHIPRNLLIPFPDDERKWYDHNCKFLNTTFGFERYPLKYRCHKEILQLDLSEYIWKNIQVNSEYTDEFHEAGFVDIPEIQLLQDLRGYQSFNPEDEDIFIPVQRTRASGAQVKIMPSMLLSSIKVKPEDS